METNLLIQPTINSRISSFIHSLSYSVIIATINQITHSLNHISSTSNSSTSIAMKPLQLTLDQSNMSPIHPPTYHSVICNSSVHPPAWPTNNLSNEPQYNYKLNTSIIIHSNNRVIHSSTNIAITSLIHSSSRSHKSLKHPFTNTSLTSFPKIYSFTNRPFHKPAHPFIHTYTK